MILTLCGDISVIEKNQYLWDCNDPEKLFSDVLDLFGSSDRVIVNLECALTESEYRIRKFGPNLKGKPFVAELLKRAGVTDCGLSNNHVLDFGLGGLRDTIALLDKAGLNWTGAGENEEDSRKDLVIEAEGKTIRVITVCEHEYSYALADRLGSRPYDPYDTAHDIRLAKSRADYVIVMYHGGKEHCRYPSPRLRKLCRAMVEDGADLVLCQHSHCIGCAEEYMGGNILYGQGNFHFVYPGEREESWNEGLAVRVTIEDSMKVEYIPVVMDKEAGTLSLAKGERKEKMLADFAFRGEELKDDRWMEGWHAFCLSMKENYDKAVASFHTGTEHDTQWFAHYLDCEAHTDVWRELNQTWHRTLEIE